MELIVGKLYLVRLKQRHFTGIAKCISIRKGKGFYYYGLEFISNINGHDCLNLGKQGHCWNIWKGDGNRVIRECNEEDIRMYILDTIK